MDMHQDVAGEAHRFKELIKANHKRIDPCFMTGKACVYSELIDREIEERTQRKIYEGFVITPFRKNIQVFLQNCMFPFIRENYSEENDLSVTTASEVRRPGVIICEGICKRIQESDFVIADVSLANANVFYELGMAYGLDQKIILIANQETEFTKTFNKDLKGLFGKVFPYGNLDPITLDRLKLSEHLWWKQNRSFSSLPDSKPSILFYERSLYEDKEEAKKESPGKKEKLREDDIRLTFEMHTRSAVGLSIDRIHNQLTKRQNSYRVIDNYLPVIESLKVAIPIMHQHPLSEIERQIYSSYCLMIRTGGENIHPMSYFWLGYCHALGKNVIPITVIRNPKDRIDDLAFDIRAQKHMTFSVKQPELLEGEIYETLNLMIKTDFIEWSRKNFWNEIMKSGGEISIFTGALHNPDYHREMIGDWDLRTVSELTSYFGRHHHRFKIETPIYEPGRAKRIHGEITKDEFLKDYIKELSRAVSNKNCIVIASPDVNPLTEIILSRVYSIPEVKIFKEQIDESVYPKALIAFKERGGRDFNENEDNFQRTLYRDIAVENAKQLHRGFIGRQINGGKVATQFLSQEANEQEFDVYGHLAILLNPFTKPGSGRKYIILLNGVSGPATFALTQALTGGVGKEFVAYDQNFQPEAESELILSKILNRLQSYMTQAVECLIKVRVGPNPGETIKSSTYDWRRIRRWELDINAFPSTDIKTTPFS